ncbi:hypothetical protein Taro_016995 [Colocasia esculenta]|uniref:GDSL esterase/lipase n=1 Tax=Colocasia esculenta TaxID=4460 RepID=A0A843UY04_COLES|nr:hypothetical protein [Colocasia esculenta]
MLIRSSLMAPTTSQAGSLLIFLPILVLSASLTGSMGGEGPGHAASASPPGMFVFGSSLVDNGNNNFLPDAGARADYLPYGIDFPSGPSGRFSNGRNMVDALGELLKLPTRRIPPFFGPATKGPRILHGVNYASGGSGISDETRPARGRVISFNQQISNFEKTTLPQLGAQLARRERSLSEELPKYLFLVGTGGNDYLLNYFLGGSAVSVQTFTASLTSTFISQLKFSFLGTLPLQRLYGLGARKFVLVTVQPIGCVPVVREMLQPANGTCVEAMNEAALLFNTNLSSMVDLLKQQMPGSHLVYVNSYKIISDIMRSPAERGFRETNKPCCTTSGDGVLCKRGGRICDDRGSYLFFDGLHPTEAVNELIARKAYDSNLKNDVYPISVKQLAAIL